MQRRGRSVMTENERTESTLGNGCFFYASDSGGGAVVGKPPNRERDRRARSITNALRKADFSVTATAAATH